MNITIVPHGRIHEVVHVLSGFAIKGAEWSLGRLSADDIVRSMFDLNVTTWIVFDDDQVIHGYLTTQIMQYPQARHFAVLNCGGIDGSLNDCVDLVFDTFEQYARDSGCDGFEIIGRPAWWKHIKDRGFNTPQYQYFKSFDKGE